MPDRNDRLVFALDTSFGPVSAAVADAQGRIIAHFEADNAPGTQAETLPPRVKDMFASAGLRFADVSRIAVTVGPGAFTGVRVGLAFAKGLRLAIGAEILGVTTLECLAIQAPGPARKGPIASVIDAKRESVYLQIFDASLAGRGEPTLLSLEEARHAIAAAQPRLLTGSGATLIVDAAADASIVPGARVDTKVLALHMVDADPARYPPTAAYLRAPDAKLPA